MVDWVVNWVIHSWCFYHLCTISFISSLTARKNCLHLQGKEIPDVCVWRTVWPCNHTQTKHQNTVVDLPRRLQSCLFLTSARLNGKQYSNTVAAAGQKNIQKAVMNQICQGQSQVSDWHWTRIYYVYVPFFIFSNGMSHWLVCVWRLCASIAVTAFSLFRAFIPCNENCSLLPECCL